MRMNGPQLIQVEASDCIRPRSSQLSTLTKPAMPDSEEPCATTLYPILSQLTLGSSIVTGQAIETTCKTGALSAKLVHLRMGMANYG